MHDIIILSLICLFILFLIWKRVSKPAQEKKCSSGGGCGGSCRGCHCHQEKKED